MSKDAFDHVLNPRQRRPGVQGLVVLQILFHSNDSLPLASMLFHSTSFVKKMSRSHHGGDYIEQPSIGPEVCRGPEQGSMRFALVCGKKRKKKKVKNALSFLALKHIERRAIH